ncbi:MAG: radical SAM protein [Candidatus Brocadiia bacterium]|nr:MAG: radical SAM protein [Candidatus Brocadiia bacterium]
MKSQDEKPNLMALEVTRKCRLNCRHCRAASAGIEQRDEELSTEQWKKIMSSVADFNKCMIILTGGEAVERGDIYELIGYGKAVGLDMVMATCGYPINDETALRLKDAGITAMSFSLDGATASTHDAFRQYDGAFEAAIAGVEAAKRAGIRFQINTTISKYNRDEIIAIARLAEKLGACCFNPFILVPTGTSEIAGEILDAVEYESILNEILRIKIKSKISVRVTCGPQFTRVCQLAQRKKLSDSPKGCIGGTAFGFINWRGDVQVCGFLDVSAGNLVENGYDFRAIWRDSKFLKEIRGRDAFKGVCAMCEYIAFCGGCRARAFGIKGDYLDSDPICNYMKGQDRL